MQIHAAACFNRAESGAGCSRGARKPAAAPLRLRNISVHFSRLFSHMIISFLFGKHGGHEPTRTPAAVNELHEQQHTAWRHLGESVRQRPPRPGWGIMIMIKKILKSFKCTRSTPVRGRLVWNVPGTSCCWSWASCSPPGIVMTPHSGW